MNGRNLQFDDALFLFLLEEGVEFVEFLFERVPEVGFLDGHFRMEPRAFGEAFLGGFGGGFDEFELLLEFLVGEKLVAPLRQCFLDLVAETLSEFHDSVEKLKKK